MKEIDAWVKIKKYTDDEGKQVCGGCKLDFDTYDCEYSIAGNGPEYFLLPGQSCPVWHGESKSEWQPIETAPKDGTEVLVSGLNYGCESQGRHTVASRWQLSWWESVTSSDDGEELGFLTHWMPLPAPPQEK